MRFIALLILLPLLCTLSLSAQHKTLPREHLVYGGIGVLNPTVFTFTIFSADGSGNPSVSGNLNYQYAITNRLLIGAFGSYYRVNADYKTTYSELADILDQPTLDDIVSNLDCILFGTCQTTVSERVSVYALGAKISYTKTIRAGFETYVSGYLGYSFNRRQTITETALNFLSEELELGVNIPSFIYFSSAGLRYYFNPTLALQAELGYGNSHLFNLGLSYNLSTKNRGEKIYN